MRPASRTLACHLAVFALHTETSFDVLLTWWTTHGDKLVLTDPWLGILEKQKVD